MHDPSEVAELQASEDVSHDRLDVLRLHPSVNGDLLQQLASIEVLQYEIHGIRGLMHLIEL